MTDLIVLLIVAIIIVFAVRSSAKHFKGEGGCCGGGTYKAKRKKLKNVIAKKTFTVEDMTCQHCVNRVQEAVNSIDGASGVVNLKKGIVVVSMSREIEDGEIISKIEKAGYVVKK